MNAILAEMGRSYELVSIGLLVVAMVLLFAVFPDTAQHSRSRRM